MFVPGDAPNADELEISLFGPGFGEALAIHVGSGEWILIDSCLLPDGRPASLAYLESLNVPPEKVRVLVASHWHDDHVGGLSQLVRRYGGAEFFVPNYFSAKEGSEYVAAYSGATAPQSRGTHELYESISVSTPVPTGSRVVIYSGEHAGISVSAHALSPVPAAWGQAMAHLMGQLPQPAQQIKHAAQPKTNIASIVVHVALGQDALLLGSDLEKHGSLGWQAVVASSFAKRLAKASFYKVAHHGSKTAHLDEIWSELLTSRPLVALTPFMHGCVSLPADDDVKRIKALAGSVHCTSLGSTKPQMSSQSAQLLKGISKNLKVLNRRMGHWRFRRPLAGGAWVAEGGGAAVTL